MFDHFSIKFHEDKTKRYYINTQGFAYFKYKNAKSFPGKFLIEPDKHNRIFYNGKQKNLARLIWDNIYKYKVKNLIFLDDNQKNCNIENLVNLPWKPTERGFICKNNLTGACCKISYLNYIKLVNYFDKKQIPKDELWENKTYIIKTAKITLIDKSKNFDFKMTATISTNF